MELQPENISQPIYIKSYNKETKTIEILYTKNINTNNKILQENITTSSIILFNKVIKNWLSSTNNLLTSHKINEIISYNPEIIIIGTGDSLVTLDYEILEPLYKNKVPFEIMDNTNCCRTYNLLANEHRNVAIGLVL